MTIPLATPRRVALLGLLLMSLVVLADSAARMELTQAAGASLTDGAHMVANIAAADD